MLSNDEIIQRLVLHEGVSLKCYICPAGYPTIGVGRNLKTNPLTQDEIKVCGDYMHGITKNAAFYLLRNDIERVIKDCKKKIPFWSQLDDERKYALIDLTFQLGIGGVLKFKNMLASMGVGNWKDAAEHCLDSKYAQQTPTRAKRIARTIETGVFRV